MSTPSGDVGAVFSRSASAEKRVRTLPAIRIGETLENALMRLAAQEDRLRRTVRPLRQHRQLHHSTNGIQMQTRAELEKVSVVVCGSARHIAMHESAVAP